PVAPARALAVLRIVVRALQVGDARTDGNRAAQVRPAAWQAGKVRQLAEREIHLRRRAAESEPADGVGELARQVLFSDQPEERPARIGARHDDIGADFLAAFEHGGLRSSVFHPYFLNRGTGADLDAG